MTLATAALLTLPPTFEVFAQDTGVSAGSLASAPANTAAPPQSAGPYIAVVTGNAVNVRSGPSAQGAYVFGKLHAGDTVQVLAEEFGWAKVRTAGPAFSQMYAYVPADRRVSISGEAASVTGGATSPAQITARTELRAPNIDSGGAPDRSWKQIGTLEPGATVVVQGVVQGDKDSVYKVSLPATGEGWVNLQFLRRATESESAVLTSAPVNTPAVGAPSPAPASVQDGTLSSPTIPPLRNDASVRTDSHGEGALDMEHTAPVVKVAAVSRRATWGDLENQWQAVRQQSQASAELDALRGRYLSLADTAPAGSAIAQMASSRAQQLELLLEAQKQAQELASIKNSLSERSVTMVQLITDIQRRAEYTAIGILNASVVYDGKRLPQLYRVTDTQTGQTIAYVLPNESIPMGTMLGTLVGVKGGKEFDSALNINVISPQVVELFMVRDTPQVSRVDVKSDATKPATALGGKEASPAVVPTTTPVAAPEEDCWEEVPPMFEPEVVPSTSP